MIPDDLTSRIIAGRASDSAPRVRARTAMVHARDRTPVGRVTEERSRRKQLVQTECPVKNVPSNKSENLFKINWTENLACDDAASKTRREPINRRDHKIGHPLARLCP